VRATARVDVPLRHKPKASLVDVAKTTIRLKAPIQFAPGTSVLAPESNAVLGELADALVRNPGIKRIEIQAHTDEPGTPEEAADLSNRRANAVRDWLIHRGVAGDRLIARGMGKTKPRRIDVNILERDDIKP
jgi:outer membrane protein OmpA-like peptidoglycan-associated protein